MALAHARRRGPRRQLDKSHPGQAHRSARKRILRRQRKYAEANEAQARQNLVQCQISITGLNHWKEAIKEKTVQIRKQSLRFFTAERVSLEEYLRVNSDLNRVSFERSAIGELIALGYELEMLEVEFDDPARAKWGRCRWIKDHPLYHQPIEGQKPLPPKAMALVASVWQTEHAGEQRFSMLSTQMVAQALFQQSTDILLHKTLIFRKVIFAPPAAKPVAEAEPRKKAA